MKKIVAFYFFLFVLLQTDFSAARSLQQKRPRKVCPTKTTTESSESGNKDDTASHILTKEKVQEHFLDFKSKYNRVYHKDEEAYRLRVFHDNIQMIFSHNKKADAGEKTYRLGINHMTDMTIEEYRSRLNGYRKPKIIFFNDQRNVDEPKERRAFEKRKIPDTVDWREKEIVTQVKDQKECGASWAFSAVASIEGQHALKTKNLVALSEQNLIDCSGPFGNDGCNGGLVNLAFKYVMNNSGIVTEESYPYTGKDGVCKFNRSNIGARISSFTEIKIGDENELKLAVANVGPISVAIDGSSFSFQSYESGVYDDYSCDPRIINQFLTVVGYGILNKTAYWLAKNSWGVKWGDKGYVMIARNKNNMCGIASMASYPNV